MRIKNIFNRIKAFNRPLWLQWNWFPKDGQPPTHSVIEILVYSIIFAICSYLFYSFNQISYDVITIDADKVEGECRYMRESAKDSTAFYFHYQKANIKLNIQRTLVKEREKENKRDDTVVVYKAEVEEDSMLISNVDSISEKILRQLGLSTPYWREAFCKTKVRLREHDYVDSVCDKIRKYHEKNDVDNYNWNPYYKLIYAPPVFPYDDIINGMTDILTKMDTLKYWGKMGVMGDKYRFNLSCGISKKNLSKNIDSTWIVKDSVVHGRVNVQKESGQIPPIVHEIRNFNATRANVKNGSFNIGTLLYPTWNSIAPQRVNIKLPKVREKRDFNATRANVKNGNFNVETYTATNIGKFEGNDFLQKYELTTKEAPKLNRYINVQSPGWFELNDISQGWYEIHFNTSTIDSVALTIDFIGVTDFFPMKIKPDEIGSSYIKFTHPDKILQIRMEGLTFYAHFKELENRQTIRCFALTAILSGLLIVLITFVILGIYRVPRIIRKTTRYDDMQKWLAYQRRHKPNIFDAFFKDMENISDDSIKTIIKDVARYYRLPISMILNKCDTIVKIKTCGEGTECETYYDLKQMEKAGINNIDTFRLTIVHELSHELLRQTRFLLFENEWWIQELAADMMVGAFSATIDDVATGKYLYMLRLQPVSLTHPDGKLRATIVEYGREYITQLRKLGEVDNIQKVLKGLPAFVYEHYQEMQESWNKVQLDDDKENAPVEDTLID